MRSTNRKNISTEIVNNIFIDLKLFIINYNGEERKLLKDNKFNVSNKFSKSNYEIGKNKNKTSTFNDKIRETNQVENAINYITGDDFPTSTSHKFNRNTREQE